MSRGRWEALVEIRSKLNSCYRGWLKICSRSARSSMFQNIGRDREEEDPELLEPWLRA